MPPVLIWLDPFPHEASKTPAYFNSLISTLCSRSMHGTMLFSSRHTVPEWNSPHGADGIQRRYRLRAVILDDTAGHDHRHEQGKQEYQGRLPARLSRNVIQWLTSTFSLFSI